MNVLKSIHWLLSISAIDFKGQAEDIGVYSMLTLSSWVTCNQIDRMQRSGVLKGECNAYVAVIDHHLVIIIIISLATYYYAHAHCYHHNHFSFWCVWCKWVYFNNAVSGVRCRTTEVRPSSHFPVNLPRS